MRQNVKFRNHFFIVIEVFLQYWWVIVWAIYASIVEKNVIDKLKTAGILAIIMAVTMVFKLIKWRKTTYCFNESVFVIEKNTVFKKKNTIAMTNIANVNINRSIFQGIFGVRKVKIDTNSSASAESEINIYLKTEDAVSLQKAIMSIIEGEMSSDIKEAEAAPIETKKATIEEILFHCVFSLKVAELVVVAISMGSIVLAAAELEEGDSVGGVMGIASLAIFIIGIIISFMKSFLAYYKLSATRSGNELSISYGFFDYKTFKLPVNKIVSIKIVEPLIARIFNKAYTEIVCVGMGDEEKELSLLSLCTSKKLLAVKLHALLPEFIPEEISDAKEFYVMKRESRKAIPARIMKSILILGCLGLGVGVGKKLVAGNNPEFNRVIDIVFICIGFIIVLYELLKNFACGYSLDNKYLRVATGAFGKTVNIVPYKNIEYIIVKKSPLYKIFGLATGFMGAKAGSIIGMMLIETGYIEDKDVEIILKNFKESYTEEKYTGYAGKGSIV